MEIVNPNQFKKIRKLEGNKNYVDIWDLVTFEEIKKELKYKSNNVRELVDGVSEIDVEFKLKHNFELSRKFCNDISNEFKKHFLLLLENYRKERRPISQKIIDYLLRKELILPKFIIANGDNANFLLENYNMNYFLDKNEFLIVFQLPKPLAKFWWKGGYDSWGDLAQNMDDTVIEWGHFYRELMPVIWSVQAYYENEEAFIFNRINKIGEHNPNKYYYIWAVSS